MTVRIERSTEVEYMQVARAITRFNLAHLPPNSSNNMTSLGYVIKDNKLGVLGGVYAKLLLGNCLSIEVLWVDEQHRNKDYGTQLMHTLEDAAKKLGSSLSIVDTFDFQALDFYKKLGYEVFGILDDCPCDGIKRFYLKKPLK